MATKIEGKRSASKDALPKRPSAAFFQFQNANREEFKKKYPDMKVAELAKAMGEAYRALDADERKQYDELAEKDKKRYEREVEVYEKKHGPMPKKERKSKSTKDDDDKKGKKKTKKNDDSKGGRGRKASRSRSRSGSKGRTGSKGKSKSKEGTKKMVGRPKKNEASK